MKIGVSTYSYRKLLEGGSFTVYDAIHHAAETGFQCIEFVRLEQKGRDTGEYAEQIKDACRKAGLEVSAYCVAADFLTGSDGDIERETQRVQRQVDIASLLSAPLLRHNATWGPKDGTLDYRDAVRRIAPAICEVSRYAAGLGIRTSCENHGMFMQDSCRMACLVEQVNCANFGLLADLGNFLCVDEDPVAAVKRLLPHIIYVHAKDFLRSDNGPIQGWSITRGGASLRGTLLGHGVVPLSSCLALLKEGGYDGVISLEFQGLDDDPLPAIEADFRYLQNAIHQ